jgi:hypothetical protein
MGAFDDLVPGGSQAPAPAPGNAFADLVPEKKGSYLSGDQGLVPDVAEDIGKGIYSGVVSLPQGITELGALGIDAALGTNTSRAVTEAFESIKPEMGAAGEVTEDLVAFGVGFIPIAGWLGKASQAAKAANAGKALSTAGRGKFTKSAIDYGSSKVGRNTLKTWKGLAGSTAVGTLGYSTAVSTDGRATASDNFDIMPSILQTEEDTGLTGRKEAGRRFRNKFAVGAEDALLSLGFDAALKGAAVGSKFLGQTKTGGALARGLRSVPSKTGGAFMKTLETIDKPLADKTRGGLQAANRQFQKYFSASGGADTKLYETTQDARAKADMYERLGVKAAEDWSKASNEFLKAAKLKNNTPVGAQKLETSLLDFLMGNTKALDEIGDEKLLKAANKMVDIRSSLDDDIITQLEMQVGVKRDPVTKAEIIDPATGRRQLEDAITPGQITAANALKEMTSAQKAQNGYLRRMFQRYTDPKSFYDNLDLTSKGFDDAVSEVASLFAKGTGRAADQNDLTKARRIVYDSLGLQGLAGLPPERALANKIKSIKEGAKGNFGGLVAKERPVLKSIDDIFVERKEILESSPNLRKLLGELTEPLEIYKRTVNDMAQANAAADMYAGMRAQGLVSNLSDGLNKVAKGGRPAIIEMPDSLNLTSEAYDKAMQPFRDIAREQNIGVPMSVEDAAGRTIDNPNYVRAEDVVQQYAQSLRDAGYRQLGDSKDIQHVFGGAYGDLTGMFVSPESFGALTAPLKLGSGALAEVTGILSAMRSLSQKMTIVPNPGAQVRNIAGNLGMLAANANLGRDTDFTDMFKIFTSSLDTLDDLGLERLAKKISLTGVADTSLITRALKEYRNAGKDLTVSGKVSSGIDYFENKIPFMKLFERVYGESDTFFKGLSLLGEEKKLRGAFANSGLSENDPSILLALKENNLSKRDAGATRLTDGLDQIEVIAGDIVKDTMPIYPRVGKAVRSIDMVPIFGNFTSFASENIRNSVNILDRGLKEMSFQISPELRKRIGEEKAAAFEKQMRAMGAQRLMSYASVATLLPQAMVKGSMIATGTTPEEMAALRQQIPDYMDGHDLSILSNNKKGKIDYIDLSYVSPYAFVLDPARAAIQRYNEAGRLGKSEAEQILSGAWRGLEMFAEPFGSESMIFERLRDVLPSEGLFSAGVGRGGKTATGSPVYADTEAFGSKVAQGVKHMLGGVIPSYFRLGVEERGGEFVPGRLYRGVMDMPGPRGEEYNVYKEGARLVTGFTPMRVDLQNDFAFKGLEYGPRRTDAKSTATRVIKQADATLEDMNAAYSTYLDNLYREQTKLYSDIQAARKLGLSDTDIRRNLVNGANMSRSEVNTIMKGKFYPTAASRELAKDINAARKAEGRSFSEERVPFGSFNRMAADRLNEPLGGSGSATPAPFAAPVLPRSNPFSDLIPSPQGSAPRSNPFSDLVPSPQGSLPQPVFAPTQARAPGPVNPALLGDDPFSAAANAQIANRLG